jgi:uncharacterized protein (TIGR02217 family)
MFIESRLLDCVSYGTEGGPTWLTRKVGLRSGHVRRNAMRSRPLYQFNILYNKLQPEDHAEVLAAFNACMGGTFGFRIKDWSDYSAEDELLTVGTGTPQVIQLIKNYTFGSQTVERPIRKPVASTVTLTEGGVPLAAVVDYTTGIVQFTATPAAVIRWSGEFDVPVTFADDRLSFSIDTKNADGFFLSANVALEEDVSA